MEEVFSSIIRTAVSFILLLIILALFGRQINAHKNHFNMAMAITIGSLIANMGFNINLDYWPMVCSFLTLVVLYYLAVISTYRLPFFQKILSGPSSLLIEEGKIIEKNMAEAKYTKEGLHQQLREKGIFSLSEVRKAILEPNGTLSIEEKAPQEKGSFASPVPDAIYANLHLPAEMILNGVCQYHHFPEQFVSWFEGYLYGKELKTEKIKYAVISSDRVLFIVPFPKN
ncbi:DUF421 domain-containing protein [Bacillus sp. FJAT-27445]|uniref:DUF421 domain-containing protein n=1 Tax=Bacillus sp. FJAT-27445 TaxID=1679166 RepID=UPI0007433F94|nr:YetF domain-containing protein [Bacillus sp. FJAT-27445]